MLLGGWRKGGRDGGCSLVVRSAAFFYYYRGMGEFGGDTPTLAATRTGR